MPQNLVSATLAAAAIAKVRASLADIRAAVPFLLSLTNEQRQELLNMGAGNLAIAEKMFVATGQNQEEVPAKFPYDDWQADETLAPLFKPLAAEVRELARDFSDTELALDSDRLRAAFDAYGYLGKHGSGPAIEEVRAMMRARHGQRPSKAPSTPNASGGHSPA